MLGLERHAARVTRYIRRLRGGSQPILAEASDGKTYIVKFTDNLQGPNLAFNESMGTELFRACGLPVAPCEVLKVTDSFLAQNPACWLETPQGRRRPVAGLCFGSRYLGGEDVKLFEILPGSYLERVKNATDFWLAWLLDVSADHSDARQAIFCERHPGQLEAVFIDFGHMFGGATGSDRGGNVRTSRHMDQRIYPRVSRRFLLTFRKILDTLDTDYLWRQLLALPDEWKAKSAIENFKGGLDRLSDPSFLDRTFDRVLENYQASERERSNLICGQKEQLPVLRPGVQPVARGRGVVVC